MQVKTVPISSLSTDPKNARKHGDRNLQSIVKSLESFGQQKPIVIDADSIVVAGNGTLEAAIALGWEEIQIVQTELAGNEAIAFAVADNRTSELAEWDQEALRSIMIDDLDEELRKLTGFNDKDLLLIMADGELVEGSPADEWDGMPEFDQPGDSPFRSIHVHFKDQSEVDQFSEMIGSKITEKIRAVWFSPVELSKRTEFRWLDESKESVDE